MTNTQDLCDCQARVRGPDGYYRCHYDEDENVSVRCRQCTCFCCSDFLHSHSWEPDYQPPSLQNKIHPLFARSQFRRPAEVPYDELLEIPLKLASRLLEVHTFAKYAVTIAEGVTKRDRYTTNGTYANRIGKTIKKSDAVGEVFDAEMFEHQGFRRLLTFPKLRHRVFKKSKIDDRAKQLWRNFVGMVEFQIGDMQDNDQDWNSGVDKSSNIVNCDNGGGLTQDLPGPLPLKLHRRFPRGCRCLVTISPSVVDKLRGYPSEQLQGSQLNTASLFIHELSHVLNGAIHGLRPEEVIYKNGCMGEAGYEAENAIFGGLIGFQSYAAPLCAHINDWDYDVEHRALIMDNWPSNFTARSYQRSQTPLTRRAPVGKYSISTRVPSNWVAALLTDDFWTARDANPEMRQLPVHPANWARVEYPNSWRFLVPRWVFKSCKEDSDDWHDVSFAHLPRFRKSQLKLQMQTDPDYSEEQQHEFDHDDEYDQGKGGYAETSDTYQEYLDEHDGQDPTSNDGPVSDDFAGASQESDEYDEYEVRTCNLWEHDLPLEVKRVLGDIVRKQVDRSEIDPADIMDSSSRPWSRADSRRIPSTSSRTKISPLSPTFSVSKKSPRSPASSKPQWSPRSPTFGEGFRW